MNRNELKKLKIEMRNLGITYQQVANRLGCRASAVCHVLLGNTASARIIKTINAMIKEKQNKKTEV